LRVLVTGSTGLLGSKLVESFTAKGHEVYSGYNKHKPRIGFPVKLDITDEVEVKKIFKNVKPEVVVHAAALTNVDECESNKELAWETNVSATKSIAQQSQKHNALLIYVSSDYVFDGLKGLYEEEDEPNPINHYGLTKLEGEKQVSKIAGQFCIVRPSVIYGAEPASGKENFALWILENLKKGKPVNVVEDQWNSPTLNTNLAGMILEVAEKKLTGVYHLAGAARVSRYEFAKLIAQTFDLDQELIKPISLKELSWIARRPVDSSLNVSKAMKALRDKPLEIKSALEELKKELVQ